jgi:CRP-like cAMP-binding protein
MIKYQNIIDDLTQNVTLTENEIDYFISHLKPRRFKKNQFLVQEQSKCQTDFFIINGLVKEFFTDINGKDFIFRFVKENDWSSDYGSYLTGQNATLNIQALESVETLSIESSDTQKILSKYPVFEKVFRIYFQSSYSSLQLRLFESISKNAEERYENFLKQYYDISQRIPQHQIAAYLGVSPEFLSKIRQKR